MATTTNYGWTTPDDTALVKDGASAIRTLGTSIDTTTKNLNPSTTLGDIEYRSSSANTNTRLGIGSTGQVLTVSGGVPSWATPSSGGMDLLSTTTLSGASTTISSISQSYKDLQIIIRNFQPSTGTVLMKVRFNGDATANRHAALSYAAGDNDNVAFDDTAIYLLSVQNTSSSTSLINARIPDYTNTTTWKTLQGHGIGNDTVNSAKLNFRDYKGYYNQTSAITSLEFRMSSGTMTAGTVLLYGVK